MKQTKQPKRTPRQPYPFGYRIVFRERLAARREQTDKRSVK